MKQPDKRDHFAALMVGKLDATLRDRGPAEQHSWPDEEDQNRETVEVILRDALGGHIAVEHTTIESRERQIAEATTRSKVFPDGGVSLPDVPQAGQYRIIFEAGVLQNVDFNDRDEFRRATEIWTERYLPHAPWPHRAGEPTYVRGRLDHFDVDTALERVTNANLTGLWEQVVQVHEWLPPDLEHLRRTRLTRALDKKVSKLLDCTGSRTILVLEDRDWSTSAPGLVSRALQEAADGTQLPDAIYHLNVTAGNPLVSLLYSADGWWHENSRTFIPLPQADLTTFNAYDPWPNRAK